jgi:hypothetical protein
VLLRVDLRNGYVPMYIGTGILKLFLSLALILLLIDHPTEHFLAICRMDGWRIM